MKSTKLSAENAVSNNHRNIWEKYRPTSTINFSDIIEDRTIYDRTSEQMESTINSSHLTEQPDIDPDAVSVDDILGRSIVHEIRHLSQSRQGTMSTSIRNSLPYKHSAAKFPGIEDFSVGSEYFSQENFKPAEEMRDQMLKDENEWEREYADIPVLENNSEVKSTSIVSHKALPKIQGKLANVSDFSGFLGLDNGLENGTNSTDMSIGRYFLNRCQDLQEMIPNKSPEKHEPMSLVPTTLEHDSTESNRNGLPRVSSNTYDKVEDEQVLQSTISLSTIASYLDESDVDSPRTFLNKLYSKRNKALTKANVKLLEKTTNEQRKHQIETTQSSNEQRPNFQQMNYSKKDENDEFNCIMNSTKIDDMNNDWRDVNNVTDKTESCKTTPDVTLGSNYSMIEDESSPNTAANIYSNKRIRSPTPKQYDNAMQYSKSNENQSPIDNETVQCGHSKNGENDFSCSRQMPRRVRSTAQSPLDDVSSIMLNNLQIDSPKKAQYRPIPAVRRCATELKSMENNTNEEQRKYVVKSRSPDFMKLSLPNYGLHGMRNSYQDAITVDKRCNSQCSTHSEFTQQDGKFPLKSNTSELVWECVKLRKSVAKSFVIKNTSDKKLNLKIGVIGPGFQVASPMDTDSLVLHGNECRTINITFCPTIIGKAIGKVTFRPTKNWPEEVERSVYLWAYGGSTVLQLQGIERGPVGSSFLKMGETSNIVSTTLERSFTIYNKGPLNGVATIFVKPKTNQCINENHISIEPNKCVIRPDCTVNIKVSYKLRRKDIERLKEKSCEVLTVGTLEVIFGSEPNRQRIATILTRHGSIPSSYKQLEFLVNGFPVASIESFKDFREHIDNVSDLFGCFKTSEIALTINRTNLDETNSADLTCIDDSVLFRTLIETPKQTAKSHPSTSLRNSDDRPMWSVQPNSLTMDKRFNSRKSIYIQNFFDRPQTFQMDSNIQSYLTFSTRSGQIRSKSEFRIDIELKKDLHIPPLSGMITIYIESDSMDIPITVQAVPYN